MFTVNIFFQSLVGFLFFTSIFGLEEVSNFDKF